MSDASVRVQNASGTGSFLNIQLVGYIKPNHVEKAIRFGLSHGWIPSSKVSIEIGGTDLDEPIAFELKPVAPSPTWFFDRYPFLITPTGHKPLPANRRITFLQNLPKDA